MHTQLFFIRKIKALFERFRLHAVFSPFDGLLINLLYLSRLSKYISKLPKLEFNDFYNSHVVYEERFRLHDFVFRKENLDAPIDYLEFGVAEGTAFRHWVEMNKNTGSRFYGFDTFTGLPEEFGVMKKEHYDIKGNTPDIKDDRITFIAGLFQDSLPGFLKDYKPERRKVIHLDADLYSATLYVLTMLYPYLNNGDIIIFDEFGVPTHEFKAFSEFVHAYQFRYTPLGAVNNYLQFAIRVEK